jgi:hypothetical protein
MELGHSMEFEAVRKSANLLLHLEGTKEAER